MPMAKALTELPSHTEPVVLDVALKQVHEVFEKLADQYGKFFTVRFADQPMVVIADADLIKFVLCRRPELFAPYRRNSSMLEAITADGIETADDDEWRQQRALIASAMESECLAQYFETIKTAVSGLKNRWLAYGESLSAANLETELFTFSIAVYTAIVFGDLSSIPADQREAAVERLHSTIAVLGERIDTLLPQMHAEHLSEDEGFELRIKEIRSLIGILIEQNRWPPHHDDGGGQPTNLLAVLIRLIAEKNWVPQQAKLVENLLQILLAAESTTANTLLRALRCLAANPPLLAEIEYEVCAVSRNGIIADSKDVKKLKTIDAAVYETMRLWSVSRFVIMEAKTTVTLDGIEIPCGTPLVLLIGYCPLDEANFDRAAVFDHRRWRDENKEDSVHNNNAFLGFGAGPRSCPGRGLAMLVMKTVLAMICTNFRIRPVSPTNNPENTLFSLDFALDQRERIC